MCFCKIIGTLQERNTASRCEHEYGAIAESVDSVEKQQWRQVETEQHCGDATGKINSDL